MAQTRRKKNFLGGLFGRRSDYAGLLKELRVDPGNRGLQREVIVAGREKNKTTEQMKAAFRKAGVSTYDTRQAMARFVEERQQALKQERKKEKKKSRKAEHKSSGKKVAASSSSKTPAVSLGGEKLPASLAEKLLKRIKPNGRKQARKKNKTVIIRPKRVTVINGQKSQAKNPRRGSRKKLGAARREASGLLKQHEFAWPLSTPFPNWPWELANHKGELLRKPGDRYPYRFKTGEQAMKKAQDLYAKYLR